MEFKIILIDERLCSTVMNFPPPPPSPPNPRQSFKMLLGRMLESRGRNSEYRFVIWHTGPSDGWIFHRGEILAPIMADCFKREFILLFLPPPSMSSSMLD